MNPVQSMLNAWAQIYQCLPTAIQALISVSVVSVFLATLFQSLNHIR